MAEGDPQQTEDKIKRARLARELANAKRAQLSLQEKERDLRRQREEEEANRPQRTCTQKETAKHFGVSPVTVRSWTNRQCPHDREKNRPRFNLEEVQTWLELKGLRARGTAHRGYGAGRPPAGMAAGEKSYDQRVESAILRSKEASAALAELNLQQRRGELVLREESDAALARAIESTKTAALAMGRKYCDHLVMLDRTQAREKLNEIGRELLNLFSAEVTEETETT